MQLIRIIVCSIVAITLVVTSASPVFALDAQQSYRQQNDVLYFGEGCAAQTSANTKNTSATTGDGGGCGNNANGDQANKDQIWGFLNNKFKEKGYTPDQAERAAAGIMGNWEQESAFNSYRQDGMGCGDGPAFGLAQWCFGRITNLKSFAAERGKEATCLGVQLEFVWSEMGDMDPEFFDTLKNATSAGNAANIFDDGGDGPSTGIRGFEESYAADNATRASKGDGVYKEYTGKDPGALANSSSSGSSGACPTGGAAGGPIPSEECAALIAQYEQLRASGKIVIYPGNEANIDKDMQNCTTDQIECGTGGGKGGVHPRILRALVAGAANSGAGTVTQWNFNTGHDCDGLNHPHGMATDLYCIGNKSTSKGGQIKTASDDCNKLFKYFYDHYDELGLTELIWQYPPPEYSCSDPKIMCHIAGHTDHIHVGTKVQ